MTTKYPYLRLKIPSLHQTNDQATDSDVWCGRTVAAMICNYYIATADPGGAEAVKSELVINQRDKPVYDLVFAGGPRANQIAVKDFLLLDAIQQFKKDGWEEHLLFPTEAHIAALKIERKDAWQLCKLAATSDAQRAEIFAGKALPEAEVQQRLIPVIRSLEAFNPVMIYTSLSSSTDGNNRRVRHLVCISGYRRDPDGMLWLHIDDPSSTAYDPKQPDSKELRGLTLEGVMEATKLLGFTDAITQLHPDITADKGAPGRRYWLRAAVLFQPNLNSINPSDDFWCDHQDSPGCRVYVNLQQEKRGSMVEVAGDPRFPVTLPEDRDPIPDLWDAVARSGEPYPLSTRRSWHDGIHIPFTESVTLDERVYAIAPGRVVIAWFPKRESGQPDRGMVVMRHAIDKSTLCFVDAREAEPPEGTVWVHSLYANLAGEAVGAASVLTKLNPGAEIQPRRFARKGAPVFLLTDAGLALAPPEAEGLPADVEEADLTAVPGTTYFSRATQTVGVELTGKPWVLDGDVIKVKAGFTGTTGRLFRIIKGSGSSRSFPEKRPGIDYVDVAVDANTTLQPTEVFFNRFDRAIVSVREVVDGLSDNSAEIAERDRKQALYDDLLGRLCGPSYVDLDGEDAGFRDFIDEQIGTMGVHKVEGKLEQRGVHVQLFSPEDLTIVTQSGGRWSRFEETLGPGNSTADFFKAQLDALLSAARSKQSAGGSVTSDPSLQGPAGDGQATSLLSLVADESPVTGEEWKAHCAVPENARELSQVVVKHRSEWMIDLVVDASNKVPIGGIPLALRKALFPKPPGLPGLESDTFWFYHPLRFIEWLRTGIDVGLHDVPTSKRDKVRLSLVLGDLQFDLVRQGDSDNYRLRLVLGDPADDGDQTDDDDTPGTSRGVLIISGIDTTNPEIEVELKRCSVTGLTLTEPGGHASVAATIGAANFGISFRRNNIAVAKGEEHLVHLLRDQGGPLDDLACSYATLTAEARYNVVAPERLSITVPGEGFVLQSLEVVGADLEEPPGGWSSGTSYDLAFTKEVQEDECAYDDLVTSSSCVFVKAVVRCTSKTSTREPVSIELSGGDLVKPVVGEWEIVQRDIPFDVRGQDVAKLQVYLSQIVCGRFGCLRGREKGPIGTVDGHYGEGTSLALWRFLLNYRPFAAGTKIATKSGEVELDALPRDETEIDTMAAELHKAHRGPTVTQELLDIVVDHYRLPFVGVACSITVDEPDLMPGVPELGDKWDDWSGTRRSRIVPLRDAVQLQFTVDAITDAPGDLSSVEVTVELQNAPEYRLLTPSRTTLADLVEVGLRLAPSGELTAKDAKPRLCLRAATGGELTSIALGGAHDLRTGGGHTGLDGAIVQKWLTKFAKRGKPYLAAKVDGAFGSASQKALKDFHATELGKKDESTYPQILELLWTGGESFEEEEAAE
jgi:hypothetical protein